MRRVLILNVLLLVAFFSGRGVLTQTTPRRSIPGIRYVEPFGGYIKDDSRVSPNIDMTHQPQGRHISRLDKMLVQGIYINLMTDTPVCSSTSVSMS